MDNSEHSVKVTKDAVPKDVKYIRAYLDDVVGHGRIGLIIESESFDELKDGDMIPILEPIFEKIR